ncbi:hypothetical protein [Paraburkholderia caribensis]|uniref:hypothetical protein n=1 Tax=Paraburkholderia caribensis TaxID=75105 RepID=UPI002863F1EE|nr:hypothetical protein [Paraburkholderia caribensis]MDR6381806.1 hypothetical protein [Paraburkholderia caribensis]
MRRNFGPAWTAEQDAIIATHWNTPTSINDWLHLLPGRSREAVEKRAYKLKLGPRRHWLDWTPEQDAELRRMWPTSERIHSNMEKFAPHSYAAVLTRAYLLGLGKRPAPPRGQAPVAWPIIERELRKGPAHRYRLAELLRLHPSTVSKQLGLQHDANAVHITDWHRRTRTSAPIPVYTLGAGVDVPKPAPLTSAEKMRRVTANARQRRILRAEPVRGVNPFATAAGLVAIPEGMRGRVYQQSMSIRDDDREAA